MASVNTLDFMTTLLRDNWVKANTGNVTPTIKKMVDVSRADYKDQDLIIVYTVETTKQPSGMGTGAQDYNTVGRYDVGTNDSYSHLIAMVTEVERIIAANVVAPDSDHDIMDDTRINELSDKTRKLYRQVVEVEIKRLAVSR